MQILNPRYYGLIARCNSCGALLGYKPEDVNEAQNIKCMQCGFTIWVPLNPNYDGVINEDGNRNDESNLDMDGSGQ